MRTSAPSYIRERRNADESWVARKRKSLFNNKQYRRVRARRLEEAKLSQKMRDEANKSALASSVAAKFKAARAEKMWGKVKNFARSILPSFGRGR